MSTATEVSWSLRCVQTGAEYPGLEMRYRSDVGGTLDVVHAPFSGEGLRALWDARRASLDPLDRSGVWRFRELILPAPEQALRRHVVTLGEGNTNLYPVPHMESYVGTSRLMLKHEGQNPTGSFKDRGMTVGATMAHWMGMKRVACASTGNTSAAVAAYAARAGMKSLVFIPDGNIAFGKLAQAMAYGASTLQIAGNFDDAMAIVEAVCGQESIYLLNSVNPFRIEGQKAIGFEILQDLGWDVPDWIVLPGGNLGNNTAIAKGMLELHARGVIDRLPRIAVVQAAGANPLFTAFREGTEVVPVASPETLASAIKIGAPVSWRKSLRGIAALDGVVTQVDDGQILDAKAMVDAAGIGAEPASCATVAGVRRLVKEGVIRPNERVVGVLTGHVLKDPDTTVGYHTGKISEWPAAHANPPVKVAAELSEVLRALRA